MKSGGASIDTPPVLLDQRALLPVLSSWLSLEGAHDLFGGESVQPRAIAEDLLAIHCARVHQVRIERQVGPDQL
jgi:hypothetical protein